MTSQATFPKQAWYVACTPDEIDAGPLGRTICGEQIVFYRGPDGVAALENFCPHRGAPLSLGKVVEGRLICGYHGLEMGCDGKTVAMPGQRVRGFPQIRSFPVVERHGYIWVWPGDSALADLAKLPSLAWAEDPKWTFGGGMIRVKCDYRLLIDNLMDLTHETYVHAGSIGQSEIDEVPCTTEIEGDTAITRRLMEGVIAPPFWQEALRAQDLPGDAPVDRWQVCRFAPPSHVLIDVGVALAGKGAIDAPTDMKAAGIVVDFLTPETETSTWYFWGLARGFKPHDQALTDLIRDRQRKIFGEDLEVLEQQQRNLLTWPNRNLLKLNIDAGGVQARRVLDRLIEEEARQRSPLAADAAHQGSPA